MAKYATKKYIFQPIVESIFKISRGLFLIIFNSITPSLNRWKYKKSLDPLPKYHKNGKINPTKKHFSKNI